MVGLVVGQLEAFGQKPLHHIIHQRPATAGHAAGRPLLDHGQHQHFRAQNIVPIKLFRGLQVFDAQAQVVKFGADLVQHPQHQSGRQDFVLDDIGTNQLQHIEILQVGLGKSRSGLQRRLPGSDGSLAPTQLGTLKKRQGIAPDLHFTGRRCLFDQHHQALLHRRHRVGHGLPGLSHKQLAGFLGQPATLGRGGF